MCNIAKRFDWDKFKNGKTVVECANEIETISFLQKARDNDCKIHYTIAHVDWEEANFKKPHHFICERSEDEFLVYGDLNTSRIDLVRWKDVLDCFLSKYSVGPFADKNGEYVHVGEEIITVGGKFIAKVLGYAIGEDGKECFVTDVKMSNNTGNKPTNGWRTYLYVANQCTKFEPDSINKIIEEIGKEENLTSKSAIKYVKRAVKIMEEANDCKRKN